MGRRGLVVLWLEKKRAKEKVAERKNQQKKHAGKLKEGRGPRFPGLTKKKISSFMEKQAFNFRLDTRNADFPLEDLSFYERIEYEKQYMADYWGGEEKKKIEALSESEQRASELDALNDMAEEDMSDYLGGYDHHDIFPSWSSEQI